MLNKAAAWLSLYILVNGVQEERCAYLSIIGVERVSGSKTNRS